MLLGQFEYDQPQIERVLSTTAGVHSPGKFHENYLKTLRKISLTDKWTDDDHRVTSSSAAVIIPR